MKHFKEFTVNEARDVPVPFDLLDAKTMKVKDAENAVEKAWTGGLTYRGMEFF